MFQNNMLNMAFPGKITNKTEKIFLPPEYIHWTYAKPYMVNRYSKYNIEYIKLERWIETFDKKVLSSYKLGYGELSNTVVIQEEK